MTGTSLLTIIKGCQRLHMFIMVTGYVALCQDYKQLSTQ